MMKLQIAKKEISNALTNILFKYAENDEEIQIKDASEYDDVPSIEGSMEVETELGNEENIFDEGFTEEGDEDAETDAYEEDSDEDYNGDF